MVAGRGRGTSGPRALGKGGVGPVQLRGGARAVIIS